MITDTNKDERMDRIVEIAEKMNSAYNAFQYFERYLGIVEDISKNLEANIDVFYSDVYNDFNKNVDDKIMDGKKYLDDCINKQLINFCKEAKENARADFFVYKSLMEEDLKNLKL